MKNICLIHPEGNIHNNPNLSAIVEILHENGYVIDIYSKLNLSIYQADFEIPGINMFLVPGELQLPNFLRRYSLFLGVDQGIIEADKLARIYNKPYGLISYEIFPKNELKTDTEIKLKQAEILACENVSFAIVQDAERGNFLNKENNIPEIKMIYIPVSGKAIKFKKRQYLLHDKFNLSFQTQILLYSGSLEPWALLDDVVTAIDSLPENWVLVIHGRYSTYNEQFERYKKHPKIYFSTEPANTFAEFYPIINSADLGLALYSADYKSKYTGKNLLHLGLSSGKISTYLQCGLPVMVNNIGLISNYVMEYQLGFVVESSISDFFISLKDFIRSDYTSNCLSFFSRYLDVTKFIPPLIVEINNLTRETSVDFNLNSTRYSIEHEYYKRQWLRKRLLYYIKNPLRLFQPLVERITHLL